jgi:hypothetical protein
MNYKIGDKVKIKRNVSPPYTNSNKLEELD